MPALPTPDVRPRPRSSAEGVSPWEARLLAVRCAAGLAAAMGLGRFAFTAVLPMMQDGEGVSAGNGSLLATGNYVGYLVGAVMAMVLGVVVERRIVWQLSSLALVASLFLMAASDQLWLWLAWRVIAGVASALLFIAVVRMIVKATWSHHHAGWAYGGVGAGIAMSSIIASVCDLFGGWRIAWVLTGLVVAVLLTVGSPRDDADPDPLEVPGSDAMATSHDIDPGINLDTGGRMFWMLVASYLLEGAGYIVAGTFLVATAHAVSTPGVAHSLWLIVGLAAVPSSVLWAWLSHHVSRPTLLAAALTLQAGGIALTGSTAGTSAVIATGLLFGGTFMGVTTLALAAGNDFTVPAAVAILSAAYAIGQVVGPVLVAPLLARGYQPALMGAAVIVALAASLAVLLRLRSPRHLLLAPAASRVATHDQFTSREGTRSCAG